MASGVSLAARLWKHARGPAAVYLGAAVLGKLGPMALVPLYTKRLSTAQYGDLALIQSAPSLLPALMTLGLVSAVPRFFFEASSAEEGRREAGGVAKLLAMMLLGFAVVFEVAIALFAPASADSPFGRWQLTCGLVACVGAGLGTVPDLYFRAAQRPFLSAAFMFVQFSVGVVSGYVLVGSMGRALRGAIEAMAVTGALVSIVSLAFIFAYLGGSVSRPLSRRALAFSTPFVAHSGATWAQSTADRWILKVFSLESQLGGYVLASQLMNPVQLVIAAWNDTDSARMGELYRQGGLKAVERTMPGRLVGYGAVAALGGLGMMTMIPLASFFIGKSFTTAFALLPLVWISIVCESLYFPCANAVYYASATRLIPLVTLSVAVLGVIMNVALIPLFGLYGALGSKILAGLARSFGMWVAARACLRKSESAGAPVALESGGTV